jgi:hypothetical protein
MSYTVRRDIETVSTVDESSTELAKRASTNAIRERLQSATPDEIESLEIADLDVAEFPAAPFEPYAITATVTITVSTDATDEQAAIDAGETLIETVVSDADLDDWEYLGPGEIATPP